jgi:hypothetical protein
LTAPQKQLPAWLVEELMRFSVQRLAKAGGPAPGARR